MKRLAMKRDRELPIDVPLLCEGTIELEKNLIHSQPGPAEHSLTQYYDRVCY